MKMVSVVSGLSKEAQVEFFKIMDSFSPRNMQNLRNLLSDIIYDTWSQTAIGKSSWGKMYAATLRKYSSGLGGVYSEESHPAYKYVNMMEDGVSPWSIRDALLNSSKVKISSKGAKYIIVPFRYRTPARGGEGKVSSTFAGVLSKDIYKMVLRGERLGADYGMLAGLKRYGGKGHGQFMTFRMVSDNTPQGKWMHPGKSPSPVYDEVARSIEGLIGGTIQNMIMGIKNE